jgi:AcrR family transcriptional regulator
VGALYRYFASKTDIIASIVEDQCTLMREKLFEATSPDGLGAALRKMAREAVDKCRDQASLTSEVFAEIQRSPALADIFRRKDAENRDALALAFRRVMPELSGDAAERMARLVFLSLDGLMLRGAIAGERHFKLFLGDFEFLVRRMMGMSELEAEAAGSGQGASGAQALESAQ